MIRLSSHAEERCQQRGVTRSRLHAFLDATDADFPAGRNCRLIRVSRQTARSIPGGERLENLALIVSDYTGQIVTVLHASRTRRGRRYRGHR